VRAVERGNYREKYMTRSLSQNSQIKYHLQSLTIDSAQHFLDSRQKFIRFVEWSHFKSLEALLSDIRKARRLRGHSWRIRRMRRSV
jgi:hypothetical protein